MATAASVDRGDRGAAFERGGGRALSLILEALKKLEREKQAPEKGFLVVAHVPWAMGSRGGPRGLVTTGVVLAMGAAAAGFWLARRGGAVARDAPSPAPTASSAPAPASAPVTQAARPPLPPSNLTMPSLPAPRQSHPGVAPPRATSAPKATPRSAAASPAATDVELRLNAISAQDGRPVAILNDRLVREGDVFEGIRVLRIGEAEVEVEVKGRKRIVTF
jgi:hypothetical protein